MEFLTVKNRTVVVTGGASGIGSQICRAFLAEGSRVAVVDIKISPKVMEEYVGASSEKSVSFFCGDITNEQFIKDTIKQTVDRWGSADILVNNAGIMYKSPVEEINLEQWRRVIEVNLTAPVICAKYVVPYMKKNKWGRIINMCSIFSYIGGETYSAYAAAKGGLLQLTKVWSNELAADGITVNAICPGWVDTPMLEGFIQHIAQVHNESREQAIDRIFALVPQKRFINPQEIASLALFLASDCAQSINGTGMVIDTGLIASMPRGLHRI